jgi:hypothetical protein
VVPRVLFGVVLVSVIGLLAAAVLGRRYRFVRRAATAACAGTIVVDAAMLGAALVASPALLSLLLAGAAVSTARLLQAEWVLRVGRKPTGGALGGARFRSSELAFGSAAMCERRSYPQPGTDGDLIHGQWPPWGVRSPSA